MSMEDPGLDRHEWESQWQALEPLVVDSPAEALPELDSLVEQMLAEAGYPVATADTVDDEGMDPEVIASYRVAHDIAMRSDSGETVDPGDIGHAVGLYRELYSHLLNRRFDTE
jgi:hypothetical protein